MPRHVLPIAPTEHYRFSFKEGFEGWDVATIQLALNAYSSGYNLAQDGQFGPLTKSAALNAQKNLGITADGIVGPQTQGALVTSICRSVENHKTPPGLLKGIAGGESGWIVPSTTPIYLDGGRDYGVFQEHLINPGQTRLEEAYSPRASAVRTAGELIGSYITYAKMQPQEAAWKLAVLEHNWPAAAEVIAEGRSETWSYVETGTKAIRKFTDPAPWVESYGIAGVKSGLDWCHFYVSTKSIYCTEWEVR